MGISWVELSRRIKNYDRILDPANDGHIGLINQAKIVLYIKIILQSIMQVIGFGELDVVLLCGGDAVSY